MRRPIFKADIALPARVLDSATVSEAVRPVGVWLFAEVEESEEAGESTEGWPPAFEEETRGR